MHPLCERCTTLGQEVDIYLGASSVDAVFPDQNLGKLAEIQTKSGSCAFCHLFMTKLYFYLSYRHRQEQERGETEIYFGLDETFRNTFHISAADLNDGIRPLQILSLRKGSQPILLGRIVDPDYVDEKLIRSWIDSCVKRHSDTCGRQAASRGRKARPIRVIDVKNECLVSADDSHYVALSYVWGKANSIVTLKSNLKDLEKQGSLNLSTSRLPETIKDAMTFVRLLNERYLWIDCLCIVQDDKLEKRFQIDKMDGIYEEALFTIVAASGDDANAGLPGIRGGSHSRHFQQSVAQISPATTVVASQPPIWDALEMPMGLEHLVKANTWYSRAWTYQERVLSRRSIIFLDNSVHFCCQQMLWVEDVIVGQEKIEPYFQMPDYGSRDYSDADHEENGSDGFRRLDYALDLKKWPSMMDFRPLVSDFSCRQLTYEYDVQAAFAGMLARLQTSFPEGFHFGHPEMFFHATLLWQPKQKLRRRRQIPPDSKFRGAVNDGDFYPSWSWQGWVGALSLAEWAPEEGYIKGAGMDDEPTWIKPTIQFFKYDLKSRQQKKIRNHCQEYRRFHCQTSTENLPHGWKRGFDPELPRNQVFYTHDCLRHSQFFWPIDFPPLDFIGQDSSTTLDSNYSALRFQTSRSWFKLRRDKYPFSDGNAYPVSIIDRNANWCGRIIYDESWQLDLDQSYEFVVISEGIVRKEETRMFNYPEYQFISTPDSPQIYQYFNVLLIEQERGLTQRKALGRITTAAWESSGPSDSEVFLT
ncbi:MAG: hypothetical protein Q9160_006067 [Pyrenula sp. 1 TL-2023]